MDFNAFSVNFAPDHSSEAITSEQGIHSSNGFITCCRIQYQVDDQALQCMESDVTTNDRTDPVGVAALLDVWGEKLGGPRAGV